MANFKYNGRRIALLVGPAEDDSDAPLSELVSAVHGVSRALNGPMFQEIDNDDVALLVLSLHELTTALYAAAHSMPDKLEATVTRALSEPDSGYRSALLDQEIDVRGQTHTILGAFVELADKLESDHPARPLARAIFGALAGNTRAPHDNVAAFISAESEFQDAMAALEDGSYLNLDETVAKARQAFQSIMSYANQYRPCQGGSEVQQ